MELQSWEQSLFLAASSFFASTLKGIKDTSWSVAAQTQQEKDSWMSSMGAPTFAKEGGVRSEDADNHRTAIRGNRDLRWTQ